MNDLLHYYNTCPEIEAFSTMKGAELPYMVIQAHQTHSDNIAIVDRPGVTREELEAIDALITPLANVAIGVRTADCVPILLHDPVHKVIAAVHSGWRGTVAKILRKTVTKMTEVYGTKPADLTAIIGPCISADSFQVGTEVVDAFREAGYPERIFSFREPGTQEHPYQEGNHIDLVAANHWLLTEAGVDKENIQCADICTFLDTRFSSARREHDIKCERIINSIIRKE